MRTFMAIVVVFGFLSALVLVFLTSADNTDRDILNMMLGVLGGTFVTVVGYYFNQRKK